MARGLSKALILAASTLPFVAHAQSLQIIDPTIKPDTGIPDGYPPVRYWASPEARAAYCAMSPKPENCETSGGLFTSLHVASGGQVIAALPGTLYTRPFGSPNKVPYAHYDAGMALCINTIDGGDGGTVPGEITDNTSLSTVINGAQLYADNHPGMFKPADSLTNCKQFAGFDTKPTDFVKSLESIALYILGIGVVGAVVLSISRDSFKKSKAAREAAQLAAEKREAFVNNEFIKKSLVRCPIDKFPRINEGEDREIELWEATLNQWPESPRTEDERKLREYEFWTAYINKFTIKEGERYLLASKGDVIDFYNSMEKWILRTYYCATGHYIQAWEGPEYKRLRDDELAKQSKWTSTKGDHPFFTTYRSEFFEAKKKFEEYCNEKKKEALEKQSGWFFANLERHFAETHGLWSDKTVPPVGDMPDTGASVPLDEYKPSA